MTERAVCLFLIKPITLNVTRTDKRREHLVSVTKIVLDDSGT